MTSVGKALLEASNRRQSTAGPSSSKTNRIDQYSSERQNDPSHKTQNYNEQSMPSFGDTNTKHRWEDQQEHSFRATGQSESPINIQDRTAQGAVRPTNATDDNLFQYSATNDRLHEEEGYQSGKNQARREDVNIHEYMQEQDAGFRNGYSRNDSEVYQKIQSDIMFSKERPELSEMKVGAFETANRLLNSKIIGHLSHHQGKVEQIADISKRVPGSTLAYSRATEDKSYPRNRQTISESRNEQNNPRSRDQQSSQTRGRAWESYQNNGSGLQK